MMTSMATYAGEDRIAPPSGRGRRRVVIALVALVALVLAAIGLDAWVRARAERGVAEGLRSGFDLSEAPEVELGGWPFTTSALGGRIDAATITTTDADFRGEGRLAALSIELEGVTFDAGDALDGTIDEVQAESGRGQAELTGPELTGALRRRGFEGTIEFSGDRILVDTPYGSGSGTDDDVSVRGRILRFEIPGTEPQEVRIPPVVEGARYTDVEVRDSRAIFHFVLRDATVDMTED